MVRLTTRKSSSQKVALPLSGASSLATRRTQPKTRSAAPAKKGKIASPKRKSTSASKRSSPESSKNNRAIAISTVSVSPVVPKIKSVLNEISHYVDHRLKRYGAKDAIAAKLKNIHSSIDKELKKTNIINPSLTLSLLKVSPSIRGVTSAPQGLRTNPQRLGVFLRDHVRSGVVRFLNGLKTQLSPIATEFRNFEVVLNKQLKKAKTNKIHWKVDPSLVRRFNLLNGNISRFKTRWYKTLNTLSLHGNRNIQIAAKSIKKDLDDMQRTLRRNLAILNRHSKTIKHKPGYKTENLFTNSQAQNIENKWNQLHKGFDQYKTNLSHFFDQLKAVKVVK